MFGKQLIAAASAAALALGLSACEIEDGNTVSGTSDAKTVTFKVWGKAPQGVDITYGDGSSNLEGKGLPFEETMKFDKDAMFYNVTAQLQGGGNVKCSVTIGDKTKKGQAKGDYNICSAQLSVF